MSARRGVALLALAPAALLLAGCSSSRDAGEETAAALRSRDPGYEARGAEIIETGADGAPRYQVRAGTIRQDAASREVQLEQLTMQLRSESGGLWDVTAARGTMDGDGRTVDLTGAVRVRGRNAPRSDDIEIRSEQLSYDFDAEVARSSADVSILIGARELSARGLLANLKDRRVRLESRVHGRFTP